MQIVNPSFTIQDDLDRQSIAVRLEACGRVCYKSEDKITEESAIPFVTKITGHGHNSVLEMAVATLRITCGIDHRQALYQCQPKYLQIDEIATGLLVTGSIRAFRELYRQHADLAIISDSVGYLAAKYPYLFADIITADARRKDELIAISKLSLAEVEKLPPDLVLRHRFVGVKFIVNRAVTHELVRHRPCSFLQESQRYCRYSHAKFGNQLTFIRPIFYAEDSVEFELWRQAMAETERLYLLLLATSTPQAARTVLPNSCKTEIIAYCNLAEWKHIFILRTSPAAEPSMREVMLPLQAEMQKRYPFC